MPYTHIRTFASTLLVMPPLITACSQDVDSETVAYEFVRLYFVEDKLAEAVKLTSGSAKTKLEELLQEIEAMDAKEPAKDKPLVKATLLETQPTPDETVLYTYRVTSDVAVEGMEPVTAKLWLSKAGNAWRVSKFVQQE